MCNIKNKSSCIVFKVVDVIPVLGKATCIAQQLIARVNTIEIFDEVAYDELGYVKNYYMILIRSGRSDLPDMFRIAFVKVFCRN